MNELLVATTVKCKIILFDDVLHILVSFHWKMITIHNKSSV